MAQCVMKFLAIVFVSVILFFWRWVTALSLESLAGPGDVLTTHPKNVQCYEIFHKASDVDWSFAATQAMGK